MTIASQAQLGESELDRLLQAEADLATRLQAARAEADQLVAGTRTRAMEQEAGLAAELEKAARALEAEVELDRNRRTAALSTGAHARAATFDAVDAARVSQLADAVVRTLLDRSSR